MSSKRIMIGAKPSADSCAQTWVQQGSVAASEDGPSKGEQYTARLTIDVTPQLRARIKMTAFKRGKTVVELLRALLEREFPDDATGVSG